MTTHTTSTHGPGFLRSRGLPARRPARRPRRRHRPRRLPARRRGRTGGAALRRGRPARRDDRRRRAPRRCTPRSPGPWPTGPGIAVFRGAFEHDVVDRVSEVFEKVIADEKAAGQGGRRPLRDPGANDRVWNALEKLAVADPEAFVDYYANDVLALASDRVARPRLPGDQPGQRGQPRRRRPDRAPRLPPGLPEPEDLGRVPGARARLSPMLTLQGAVAHCDMPVESGPTLYLPHSQKYPTATSPTGCPSSRSTSSPTTCSCPSPRGRRVLQPRAVPRRRHQPHLRRAPHGQPAAGVVAVRARDGDRRPASVVEAVYPALSSPQGVRVSPARPGDVVAASAEGYAFPTNLDRDQPVNGLPRRPGRPRPPGSRRGDPVEELAARLEAHEQRTSATDGGWRAGAGTLGDTVASTAAAKAAGRRTRGPKSALATPRRRHRAASARARATPA